MEYTEKLQAAQIATCRVRATAPRRVAVLGAIRFTKHLPIIFLKFSPQGTEAITKYLYLIICFSCSAFLPTSPIISVPQIIVPTIRTTISKTELFNLQVIVLSTSQPSSVLLYLFFTTIILTTKKICDI